MLDSGFLEQNLSAGRLGLGNQFRQHRTATHIFRIQFAFEGFLSDIEIHSRITQAVIFSELTNAIVAYITAQGFLLQGPVDYITEFILSRAFAYGTSQFAVTSASFADYNALGTFRAGHIPPATAGRATLAPRSLTTFAAPPSAAGAG